MNPLFMWAGGKNKMIKKYQPYLPLKFDSYIEPFLGAGAMLIWAFENNKDCERFYINDINSGIIAIYGAVKNDLENFKKSLNELNETFILLPKPDAKNIVNEKLLKKKYNLGGGLRDWKQIFKEQPSRRSFYYWQRDIHAFDFLKFSKTNEAALLYFLMKTGFNRIWQANKSLNGRFGTPCGLLNQKTSSSAKAIYWIGIIFCRDVKLLRKTLRQAKRIFPMELFALLIHHTAAVSLIIRKSLTMNFRKMS